MKNLVFILLASCTKNLNRYYEQKNGCLVGINLSDREINYDKDIQRLMFDNIWNLILNDPRFSELDTHGKFFFDKNEIKSALFNKIMKLLDKTYVDRSYRIFFNLYESVIDNYALEIYKLLEILFFCDTWGEYVHSENKIRFYENVNKLITASFKFIKNPEILMPPNIKYKDCIDQEFLNDLKCSDQYEGTFPVIEKKVKKKSKKKQPRITFDEFIEFWRNKLKKTFNIENTTQSTFKKFNETVLCEDCSEINTDSLILKDNTLDSKNIKETDDLDLITKLLRFGSNFSSIENNKNLNTTDVMSTSSFRLEDNNLTTKINTSSYENLDLKDKNTTTENLETREDTNYNEISKSITEKLEIEDDTMTTEFYDLVSKTDQSGNSTDLLDDLQVENDTQNYEDYNITSENYEGYNSTSENYEGYNSTSENHEDYNSTSENHEDYNITSENYEGYNSTSENHEDFNITSENNEDYDFSLNNSFIRNTTTDVIYHNDTLPYNQSSTYNLEGLNNNQITNLLSNPITYIVGVIMITIIFCISCFCTRCHTKKHKKNHDNTEASENIKLEDISIDENNKEYNNLMNSCTKTETSDN